MYRLASGDSQGRMFEMSTGATVPHLNMADIRTFQLPPLPSMSMQRRIAAVLSAFDELIEINKRRIELLEDLARSLYREWFVHFRFPGREEVKLVDSELGPIPEGWEVASLAELVTTQYGFTASAATYNVGPRFLRGMDVNKRSYVDWSQVPYCEIDDGQLEKFRLELGDVCVVRMADPGKVGIVETAVEAVFASYLVRLRSIEPRLPPYQLFYHLDSAKYQDWIGGSSTGSTRKSASASVLTEPQVAVPALEVATRFESLVARLRGQLSGVVEHSACLAATRDLLLPRLVTGRLDISDVDLGVLTPTEAG
jgi:type I restriction enzyme S subunit